MFSVRALVLTAALVVGYWLLISVEVPRVNPYSVWYENRIAFYYDRLDTFAGISSVQKRMFMRHTFNYELCRLISERLKPGDTLLLPPRAYANAMSQGQDAIWTDARIFRYLSNKAVPLIAWEDAARHRQANIIVALEPTAFELVRTRTNRVQYDSVLTVYHLAAKRSTKP